MSSRAHYLVKFAQAEVLRREGVTHSTFVELYRSGAPWEIGLPQPEVVHLEESGALQGQILDVGCGKGENAFYLASRGRDVLAVDFVEEVVQEAQKRSEKCGIKVDFIAWDALNFAGLGRQFDTVLDSATFHTFSDDQRVRYTASLKTIMKPGAILHLICISDQEERLGGPRRVSQQELRDTFSAGWEIHSIRETRYLATIFPDGANAWVAKISNR
jgi:cyclopropane fatty-acyl-phospholipid synthase-like methyltransferase